MSKYLIRGRAKQMGTLRLAAYSQPYFWKVQTQGCPNTYSLDKNNWGGWVKSVITQREKVHLKGVRRESQELKHRTSPPAFSHTHTNTKWSQIYCVDMGIGWASVWWRKKKASKHPITFQRMKSWISPPSPTIKKHKIQKYNKTKTIKMMSQK